MGHIYIVRHGPTHHDKLDSNAYRKQYAPQIKNIINKYGNVTRIYSSPIKRCMKTARILAKELGLSRSSVIATDDLLRIDSYLERTYITKQVTERFGRKLRKSKENVLVITHSSVIRYVLEGLSKTNINKFYVNEGSITVFDNNQKKFVDFNHEIDPKEQVSNQTAPNAQNEVKVI